MGFFRYLNRMTTKKRQIEILKFKFSKELQNALQWKATKNNLSEIK